MLKGALLGCAPGGLVAVLCCAARAARVHWPEPLHRWRGLQRSTSALLAMVGGWVRCSVSVRAC